MVVNDANKYSICVVCVCLFVIIGHSYFPNLGKGHRHGCGGLPPGLSEVMVTECILIVNRNKPQDFISVIRLDINVYRTPQYSNTEKNVQNVVYSSLLLL